VPYGPLNFDFEPLRGQRVISIEGTKVRRDREGCTICDDVALSLQEISLLVSVNLDTDEIILQLSKDPGSVVEAPATWTMLEPLNDYVGRELGWCWVGRNYLGYADTLVLSFSGIEPDIALCGLASSLWFYKIRRV
jgi:hypothetical protein